MEPDARRRHSDICPSRRLRTVSLGIRAARLGARAKLRIAEAAQVSRPAEILSVAKQAGGALQAQFSEANGIRAIPRPFVAIFHFACEPML
jgi:hypothetical protein